MAENKSVSPLVPIAVMNVSALTFGALIVIWPNLFHFDTRVAFEILATGMPAAISQSVSSAILIAAGFAITLLSIAGFVLGALELRTILASATANTNRPLADKLATTGRQLDGELSSILAMLRTHLEANENFSEVLAKAYEDAPVTAKPEQVRMVISYLIAENTKMQRDAGALKQALEQSKVQIEKLRLSLAEAEAAGLRDPLTMLGNRRSFDMNLAREIRDAHEGNTPLCLVMGDIDHFKRVNDTFGHLIGDEVLKMFANLLACNVKGRDTVARYGGEEFAIILPETEVEGAKALTERIRTQFEAKRLAINKSGEQIGKITASFGIAGLHQDDTPRKLVHRADAKLYEAKCAGRNRVTSA